MMGGCFGGGGMGAWMGAFLGFGWLFWIALLVLIIVAIIRLWPQPRREEDALAILRERYARGEIDKEEYEKRRRDLMP